MPYGIQSMLKEGHQHLSGLEEAVLKNIEAVKALSNITRTSLGPNGATPRGWRPPTPPACARVPYPRPNLAPKTVRTAACCLRPSGL